MTLVIPSRKVEEGLEGGWETSAREVQASGTVCRKVDQLLEVGLLQALRERGWKDYFNGGKGVRGGQVERGESCLRVLLVPGTRRDYKGGSS